MRYLILTSRPEENTYRDTDHTYSYPKQYFKYFEGLHAGEPVLAILYEPRRGRGRQAYVGWTLIKEPPEVDPQERSWQRVRYEDGIRPFGTAVSRLSGDRAYEEFLRALPLQEHGMATRGRSVREVSPADFGAILQAAGELPVQLAPVLESAPIERAVVSTMLLRLARERGFRQRVLSAYGFRCAVSGIGNRTPQGAAPLLDAAHLRGVAAGGSDRVDNGMAMTPTLHRLYDAGLFTLEERDGLRVRVSSRLAEHDLGPTAQGSVLRLHTGLPVLLPERADLQMLREAIRHHRKTAFLG